MKQPITTKKIIYCRPHNGFNDMLVHMNENYKYALKYDRHLFINTDLSGFLDNFAHYFESLSPNVTFGSQEDFKHFLSGHCTEVKHMNVYPPDLQNRLFDYQTFRDFNSFKIHEKESHIDLSADLTIPYDEFILINHTFGGGGKGIEFLRHVRIHQNVAFKIREKIASFGKYDAIHIRNTDFKTDYKPFLDKVIEQSKGRTVVVCTDDIEVQQYAMNRFGSQLKFTHEVPDLQGGRSLHNNQKLNRYDINVNTLTDLMVLCSCQKLYTTQLVEGSYSTVSGFSVLAKKLHKDILLQRKLLHQKITILDLLKALPFLRKKLKKRITKFRQNLIDKYWRNDRYSQPMR